MGEPLSPAEETIVSGLSAGFPVLTEPTRGTLWPRGVRSLAEKDRIYPGLAKWVSSTMKPLDKGIPQSAALEFPGFS